MQHGFIYRAVFLAITSVATAAAILGTIPLYFTAPFGALFVSALALVLRASDRYDAMNEIMAFAFIEHEDSCPVAQAEHDGGPGEVTCTCPVGKLERRIWPKR